MEFLLQRIDYRKILEDDKAGKMKVEVQQVQNMCIYHCAALVQINNSRCQLTTHDAHICTAVVRTQILPGCYLAQHHDTFIT